MSESQRTSVGSAGSKGESRSSPVKFVVIGVVALALVGAIVYAVYPSEEAAPAPVTPEGD
jgi:hypothetical protein